MSGPGTSLAVDVEVDGVTRRAGTATFPVRGTRLLTQFGYDRDFVRDGYDLDPTLLRESGASLVEGLPGCFADTAPDWWGRSLIARNARVQARERGGTPPLLTEVDYLLGVSDLTRQGALRFRASDGERHLADDVRVPALVALPELLAASDAVLTDTDDEHVRAALQTLLAAGSGTLGGARPKASVYSGTDLYIAKFPHPVEDPWDVMAWEKTVLDLAAQVGISVPDRQLVHIGGRSVLLVRRFDRAGTDQRRVGYVSASTLLGGSRSQERDYLDVQAAIEDLSAAVDDDLVDLFRRMTFSVAVHNTDDHLRNHGFVRTPAGWRLSPLFDVNPNPDLAAPRSTSINGESFRPGAWAALRASARYFGLSDSGAATVLADVAESIGTWREVAAANSIDAAEMDLFAPVFEGVDRRS